MTSLSIKNSWVIVQISSATLVSTLIFQRPPPLFYLHNKIIMQSGSQYKSARVFLKILILRRIKTNQNFWI